MTALPVLLRECRVEARRSLNYWLRVLGAGVMMFVFMGLVSRDERSAALLGFRLFPYFHAILLLAICVIAPLLTADCLAQEKREGTMELLMLTPLTSGESLPPSCLFTHYVVRAHAGRVAGVDPAIPPRRR
jgi:ABC-type transport system involved in cytochrome c biogenesis permease component